MKTMSLYLAMIDLADEGVCACLPNKEGKDLQ